MNPDAAHHASPAREDAAPARAEASPTAEGAGPTGDRAIDAALSELARAPADDLDAQVEAGQRVHQTLQARLSDLGGA